MVELINGVLNHTKDIHADDADATITMSRDVLNDIMLGQVSLAEAEEAGDVKIDGDEARLEQLVSYLDSFDILVQHSDSIGIKKRAAT